MKFNKNLNKDNKNWYSKEINPTLENSHYFKIKFTYSSINVFFLGFSAIHSFLSNL